MDYKEAIEKAIHWRHGNEEVIYPEIMLFLSAVYHDDPDAEEFYRLCFDVTKEALYVERNDIYNKMDNKYGKWIYGE